MLQQQVGKNAGERQEGSSRMDGHGKKWKERKEDIFQESMASEGGTRGATMEIGGEMEKRMKNGLPDRWNGE